MLPAEMKAKLSGLRRGQGSEFCSITGQTVVRR